MGPALSVRPGRPLRWLIRLVGLSAIAVLATWVVTLAWTAIGGGPLGRHGLIALSLGVAGTTALTWMLMALAFKSSREGWDERADGSPGTDDQSDKP